MAQVGNILFVKEKGGHISMFEITKDNRIIMSGNRWREKKSKADGLPLYGSCRTGNLGSKKEAKAVLKELITLIT